MAAMVFAKTAESISRRDGFKYNLPP